MITIKKNDTRPFLKMVLKSSGLPIDLSTASSVKFLMRNSAGVNVINAGAAILSPPANGEVQYTWQAGDTAIVGVYQAEWKVTWADTTIQSFPGSGFLNINIENDLE